MSTVDNRVVRMEFDNKQFEQGVSTTMSTLSKLKEALNFKKGGFDELQKSANAVSFDPLSNQVSVVQQKFSLLGELARNVFDRISNKVIDTATTMGRALTIDPFKAGFQEYGLNLDSTRTIMSGTGDSVEKVTEALNELNEYADKTIYSFSDMTSSIGKFTNAGIELKPATAAIKGISNAAADAGADTQKASIAMYNISQSMAQGYLSLQDWRSVNNTASMGTKDFRQNLIDTAVAMGTLRKEGDKYVSTTTNNQGKVSEAFDTFKGFDMSLQHQWATTEVMTEAYRHYAMSIDEMTESERDAYEESLRAIGFNEDQIARIEEIGNRATKAATEVRTVKAMWDALTEGVGSGWAKSFQYIFGDLDEATALWTGVKDEIESIIDPITKARNKALEFWHDAEKGGRTTMIEALSTAWQGVKTIMEEVGKAFSDVFPPITGQTLVDITNRIADMANKFKDATENSKNLRRVTDIIKGVLNAFKMGAGAAKAFWEATKPVRDVLGTFATDALRVGAAIGRFVTGMANAKDPLQYFYDGIRGVGDAGKKVDRIIQFVVGGLDRLLAGLLDLIGVHIEGNPISDFVESIRTALGEHFKLPSLDTIKTFVKDITDAFSNLANLAAGGIGGLFSGIGDAFKSIFGAFDGAADKLKGAGDGVGDVVKSVGKLDTAKGVLDGFVGFVSSMADIFLRVFSTIADYLPKAFEYLGSADFQTLVNTFIGIMTGGLINSIRKFVDMLTETKADKKKGGFFDIIEGLKEKAEAAIGAINEVLEAFAKTLEAFANSVNAGALLRAAISVGVLVLSLAILANLDATKMANGVAAIAFVMGVLFAGFNGIDLNQGVVAAQGIQALSNALIKMAIAVGILAIAAKILSSLGIDQLAIGLIGIAVAMGILVAGVSGLAKYGGALETTAGSMLALAVAIAILSVAVKSMSSLSLDELLIGLGGVGGLLAEVALFSKKVESSGLSVSSAISILVLAAALKVLETSVATFANMRLDAIAKGLAGVGGLLGALVIFSRFANTESFTISSAISILLLAEALKSLETAAIAFAGMQWPEVAVGLSAVGSLLFELAAFTNYMDGITVSPSAIVTLVAITAAVTILSEVVKSLGAMGTGVAVGLGGLAGSLIILVVSLKVLGTASGSMLVGAAALLVLSAALRVFVPVLQSLAAIGDTGILVSLLGLAGALTILAVAGAIFAALGPAMLTGAAGLLAFGAACIVAGVGIFALGTGLVALGAGVAAFGAALAMNAGGIASAVETIGGSIGTAIGNAIIQLVTTLNNGVPTILESLGNAIHAFGDFIINEIPYIMSIGALFITSFAQTVASQAPQLSAAVGQLIASLLITLVAWIPPIASTLIQGTVTLMNAVANGIRDNGPQILAAIRNILSSAIELVITALADVVRLIPGIGPQLADTIEGAKDVVREHLAPETLEADGKAAVDGVTAGVENAAPELQNAAKDAAQAAHDGMEEPLSDGSDLAGGFMDSILSTFQNSTGELGEAGTLDINAFLEKFGDTGLATEAGSNTSNATLDGLLSNVPEFSGAGDMGLEEWLSSVSDPGAASAAGGENAQAAANGASLYNDLFAQSGIGAAGAFNGSLLDLMGANSSGQQLAQAGAASAQDEAAYAVAGETNTGAFANSVNSSTAAETAGGNLSKKGARGASNQSQQWRNSANTNTKAYTSSVNSANASPQGAHLGNTGASGASGTYGGWYGAGSYVSTGFGWGILSGMAHAMAQARAVAQAALNSVKSTINSASPSKETMKYGGWFSEGFAIGIGNLTKYAERSGARLGQKTLDALSVSAEAITNYAKMDYDIDPTIRPVLDLTDIQNGVLQANGLIGGINGSIPLGLGEASYAQSIYGGIGSTAVNPMQEFAKTFADKNAQSISDAVISALDSRSSITNYYVNDAIVNGDAEIQSAFLQLFDTLERKGAMNVG